jgi:NADH dehydrogenase FAD-containing subunit
MHDAGLNLGQGEYRFDGFGKAAQAIHHRDQHIGHAAEVQRVRYDYLVVALGNRLAFDQIDGFAEHGHSVSDFYHGNRLRDYLFNGGLMVHLN